MTKKALTLALEALETAWYHVGTFCPTDEAIELYDDARAAIKEALAQPQEQRNASEHLEPVAWATREDFYRELDRSVERVRKEMEVKSVTMRCKDYDIALPIIDTHFGRVLVGQVSTPPQRKPLTDKQMPTGWVFYTADFSMRASGKAVKGSVLLVRDEAGRKWWHGLEGNRDSDDFPPLYVGAEGETFEQALANAANKARAIEAAHGIKE